MNTIKEKGSAGHLTLLDEYRIALRKWSEAKAHYPRESEEFAHAAGNLEEIEKHLRLCDGHPATPAPAPENEERRE